METDRLIGEYERLSSDLLEWIRQTIEKLNDRHFVNSLSGVQKQLAEFNSYRTEEKRPKFVSLVVRIKLQVYFTVQLLNFLEKSFLTVIKFFIFQFVGFFMVCG